MSGQYQQMSDLSHQVSGQYQQMIDLSHQVSGQYQHMSDVTESPGEWTVSTDEWCD